MGWVLLFVALVGFSAWRLRLVLAPSWSGAPARLVETVLGVSLAIVLAEALGLAGLLSGLALELGAGAVAIVTWAATREALPAEGEAEEVAGWPALACGAAVAFAVLAIWLLGVLRVLDGGAMVFDSNWYHLPLAAGFARSESVTAIQHLDPLTLARFYPADSELVHAIGMAIGGRDVLSPLLNLAWMALALLAGWCIGRPFGAAPLSLLGVAVVLASHVFSASQAGSATNDIAATAALLAAAGILVNARDLTRALLERRRSLGPVLVAGLAVGIAAGTKLNFLVPAAVLTVGVVVAVGRGRRLPAGALWLAGAFATGGLWYARNVGVTGNPLPWLRSIGPLDLPSPDGAFGLRPDFTVVHYLGDGHVWSSRFLPGLHVELGDLWPLLLALALAGMLASIVRPAVPMVRSLGLAALAGVVAYAYTPLSAAGPEGDPVTFATNLRWLAPFLALGVALLPLVPVRPRRVPAVLLTVALLAVGGANLDLGTWVDDSNLGPALLIALAVVATGLAAVAVARSRLPAYLAVAVAGLAAVALVVAYGPEADDYLGNRFRSGPPGSNLGAAFDWARDVRGARIALGGTSIALDQYPLYGRDVSNDVFYLGREGPHGAFGPIDRCAAWRLAVDSNPVDYVVTAPDFNAGAPDSPLTSPEGAWTGPGTGSVTVVRDGPVAVFRIDGPLDPRACGKPRGAARAQETGGRSRVQSRSD